MISCKRATELISRSMEQSLSVKEELALKFHLFLCETCDLFRKQLLIIRRVISNSHSRPDVDAGGQQCLSENSKARLIETIKNAQKKSD